MYTNGSYLQVELWGIFIFLIYACYFTFSLFFFFANFTFLTTNILLESLKRNEGYKYEKKLVYNTCDVINRLRDLKQTCWQTGSLNFQNGTNCALEKLLTAFLLPLYETVVISIAVP